MYLNLVAAVLLLASLFPSPNPFVLVDDNFILGNDMNKKWIICDPGDESLKA